jgi:hypothetical protein
MRDPTGARRWQFMRGYLQVTSGLSSFGFEYDFAPNLAAIHSPVLSYVGFNGTGESNCAPDNTR